MTAALPEALKPQLHRMVAAGKTHGECAQYFRTSRGLDLHADDIAEALGVPVAGESHARRIRAALTKKRELTLDDLARTTGSNRTRIRLAINKLLAAGEVRRCFIDGVALFSMGRSSE